MRPILFVSHHPRPEVEVLRRALEAHPAICVTPETRWIPDAMRSFPAEGAIEGAQLEALKAAILDDPRVREWEVDLDAYFANVRAYERITLRDAVLDLLRAYRDTTKPNATILGSTKALFIKQGTLVKRIFPEAKFLTIVRDARAVAVSLADEGERDVEAAAVAWRGWITQAELLDRKHPGDSHAIAFETADPARTMDALSAFAGVERSVEATDALQSALERYGPLDAWKDRLSQSDVAAIDALAGSELRRHGYVAGARPEVALVSYPKSGRTWLRLMIGRAMATHFEREDEDLLDLEGIARQEPAAPMVRVTHDEKAHTKTAAELVTSKEEFAGKKVVLLYRDVRDIVVSYFFEVTRRNASWRAKRGTFDGELSAFLRHDRGSVDTVIAFYNIWAANRHVPEALLLVRYEDLRARPREELRRVLDFSGLSAISDSAIAEAVEFASFDRMRQMELTDELGSRRLRAADPNDPESFKTRRGKVGGYADYLGPEDLAYLEQKLAELSAFYR